MRFLGEVILLLIRYSYWIVLASALLGGEELIIFFAILSGYRLITLWKVALIGFIGILIADCIWFFFARTKVFDWIRNKLCRSSYYHHANNLFQRLSHKNDLIYLALTKFIYGFRIISILKVSRRKRSFFKFLLSDSVAIIVWSAIMLPIGWILGKTFFSVINVFDNANKIFIVAIVFFVITYIIERTIRFRLEKAK